MEGTINIPQIEMLLKRLDEVQLAQGLPFKSQQRRLISLREMAYLMGVSTDTMTKYISGTGLQRGYLHRPCPAVRPPRGNYQIPLDEFEKWKDELITYWGKI